MFKFFQNVSCDKFSDAHAATCVHSYFLSNHTRFSTHCQLPQQQNVQQRMHFSFHSNWSDHIIYVRGWYLRCWHILGGRDQKLAKYADGKKTANGRGVGIKNHEKFADVLPLKTAGGGRILPGAQKITCHFSQDHAMVTKFLDFIKKHPK